MISASDVYFYVLLFWSCQLHDVIADAETENCCCEEKKTVNIFGLPSEQVENRKPFNYTDNAEDIFRKIGNDSDIIRTAETLDKGYYTALCWSEIITLTERKNGTNTVTKEYAITFETKSDIPDKYLEEDNVKFAPEYKQYQIYDQITKKSEIVNFTTISKSDEAIVRQSKKMFCGSGPIYTKEFTKWSQSDRKRVEIKVSPKRQNLIASNINPYKQNVFPYRGNISKEHTNPSDIIEESRRIPENPFEESRRIQDNPKKGTTSVYLNSPQLISNVNPHFGEKVTPKLFTNVTAYSSKTNTPNDNLSSTLDGNTSVSIPQFIYSSNPIRQSFEPNYSFSPKHTKGNVEKVTSNPNLADGDHDSQNDKVTLDIKDPFSDQTFHSVTPTVNIYSSFNEGPETYPTTRNNLDSTVTTRTVTAILNNGVSNIRGLKLPNIERSRIFSSTASPNPDVSQTPLGKESSPNAMTTPTTSIFDDDNDFSDELGDIRKDITKSTDCSTEVTEKLTTLRKNAMTTVEPVVNTHNVQVTTKAPSDIRDGFGDGANRIAFGDYQGPNEMINENKPDTVRNSTEIVLPIHNLSTPNVLTDNLKRKTCVLPSQKIRIKVRISIDHDMESTEPDDYYFVSSPIMGIEKVAEVPIRSIKEILTVPDELINAEWNNFIKDLGNQFFAINKERILNFTQLVSHSLNSTTHESELDYQIFPEETVKRLQGIRDYLQLCKILNSKPVSELGVTPEFRFSGELGQQGPMIPLKRPDYGFYNYMLSPHYSSNNNYPTQSNSDFTSYTKEYPMLNQLLQHQGTENFQDLVNKLRFYYLPQQYNSRNLLRNEVPSPISTASSSHNEGYRVHRNGVPLLQKETNEPCPGCKRVNEFTNSLNKALNRLQSFLQTKNEP